jgi:hypothetical protein
MPGVCALSPISDIALEKSRCPTATRAASSRLVPVRRRQRSDGVGISSTPEQTPPEPQRRQRRTRLIPGRTRRRPRRCQHRLGFVEPRQIDQGFAAHHRDVGECRLIARAARELACLVERRLRVADATAAKQ